MQNVVACLDTVDDIAVCDDTELLVRALRRCASDLLNNLARMAAIVRRLDELGAAIELDHALFPYIRLIANGELSASCLVACAGDVQLLEQAMKLPLPVQEQIAKNEPFKILDQAGAVREVHPLDMTKRELLQVFGKGKVRSEEEQKRYLETSGNKSAACKARLQPASLSESVLENLTESKPRLPFTPRPGNGTPARCPECGGRTSYGHGGKCLACKLKDKDQKRLLENAEEDTAVWRNDGEKSIGDDNPNEELAEGWQDRLAQVRAAKESGNEAGFHVDWLMNYIDEKNGGDDFDSAKMMVLLEKLSAAFGYELAEAAA